LLGELILQLVKDKPHLVLQGSTSEVAAAQALVQVPVSLQAQLEPLVQLKK
jgi:hypothetical protein